MMERALRNPARRVACSAVRQVLYSVEREDRSLPARLERHRAVCLSCQAEAARQRRIVRALADMATQVEPAPLDLAPALLPEGARSRDPVEAFRGQAVARTALAGAASLAALGIAVALRNRAS